MPRYFFDVEDGERTVDEQGTALNGPEEVAALAMRTLLDIARLEVIKQDERALSVTVRDEAGAKLYRTELTVRSAWLDKAK